MTIKQKELFCQGQVFNPSKMDSETNALIALDTYDE